jgi:hypothetical protein
MSVHTGQTGKATPSGQFAAQQGHRADAVFALGDEVGDERADVPLGAVGRAGPVGGSEPAEQRERGGSLGKTDLGRPVAVDP